jgi:TnpA family transposase
MTDINIFEFATREKLRFDSSVGSLTVEQLWDLPLTSIGSKANLNAVGIQFVKALKSVNEDSLVNPAPTGAQKVFQIQLDIVKHIIAVKQEEEAAKKEAAEKKVRKAKLQEALARKEDSALEEMTPAELKKMIAEL